jgi:hypothetical protein
MDKFIIISQADKQYFSAQATLVALGIKMCQLKFMEPIYQKVKIAQKIVKYTPTKKLTDGLVRRCA